MDLFTVLHDSLAIVKLPKGVHKQVKVYRRGDLLYIPHSGGFVEIRYKDGAGNYVTGHPDIVVIEIDPVVPCHFVTIAGLPRIRYGRS